MQTLAVCCIIFTHKNMATAKRVTILMKSRNYSSLGKM